MDKKLERILPLVQKPARYTGGEYGESGMAAVILGADNASPLTVATAYATLAAGGKRCDPVPVSQITAFDGKKYAVSTGNCKQVVDPVVAYQATRILQSVLTEGTGNDVRLTAPLTMHSYLPKEET